MSRDPHTPPPPSQMVHPPLWQGRGGFLSSARPLKLDVVRMVLELLVGLLHLGAAFGPVECYPTLLTTVQSVSKHY